MKRKPLMKRKPAPVSALQLALTCGIGGCSTLALAAGPAGVKLDGTLGGSAAVLAGPTYNITQSLGRLAGGNLFFSFQYFNIATDEIAKFTTTSTGINNVISRVTGGYASTIDGEIELTGASAAPNFYFINPSGVTFTANASVNVPAAFAVTTANYLKFSDGNFYSDPTKTSTLSAMAPEAFGFLGTTRAPVNIDGAQLPDAVGGSGEFQVVAGDVTIDGGGQLAAINTTSGDVRVIAMGKQAVEVPLTGTFNSSDGTVTLKAGGQLDASVGAGQVAGGLYVSAGTLQIDGTSDLTYESGIYSNDGGTGAGPIRVDVAGSALLNNGGIIGSITNTNGAGASITINAGALTIQGENSFDSSSVQSVSNGAGAGGAIAMNVAGPANILNGGFIESYTANQGAGGSITLNTGALTIQGQNSNVTSTVFSLANGAGAGGAIDLNVTGPVTVVNGGGVMTATFGTGDSGAIALRAESLDVDGATSSIDSFTSNDTNEPLGNAGQVSINTSGAMVVTNGASIGSSTLAPGNAGNVIINAGGALTVAGGASISASTYAGGNAGDVIVTAGSVNIAGGAYIETEAFGLTGNAGQVIVSTGSLTLNNGVIGSGNTEGVSGAVTVNVTGAVSISNGLAGIATTTDSAANAGNVTVTAGSVDINGATSFIQSGTEGTGNGGSVSVTTSGAATITNGAVITSGTTAAGNAGNVTLKAGSLDLDGANSQIDSGTSTTGNGGLVSVTTSGATTITNGRIVSATSGAGNAGNVTLKAGSLDIDGAQSGISTGSTSTGNGGLVSVTTSGATMIANGGQITSSSEGAGDAGSVTLNAGSLDINGGDSSFFTGISSRAHGSGNAGRVSVTTSGAMTITNGAEISSSTLAAGNAGSVTLKAGSLDIDGGVASLFTAISTEAASGSSGSAGSITVDVSGTAMLTDHAEITSASFGAAGQPGTVAISAGTLVVGDNGLISIKNSSIVADPTRIDPTQINIHAGTIQMDGAQITAASTGNITASAIDIDYQQSLHLDPSSITTTSNQGNGGPITITGRGLLWLQNSSITTSVLGTTNGNGGDIRITVPYIVLDSGVIQANTTAPKASGGDVVINAQALVPSFDSYVLGGSLVSFNSAILGENVVQAAAPDGVSGTLDVTVPSLDLGSALLGLTGTPSTPIALSRSLCTYRQGSSLSVAGRGGLPVSYRDPLWVDFGEAKSAAAGAAPSARQSVSDPPYQRLSLIACR